VAEPYYRDVIGYGAKPPDPKWPGDARLAINFVMNYEEGSEPSMQDGEGYTETALTDAQGRDQGVHGRDPAAEGLFEYGSRVGFWRLMRLFQDRNLPMTIFGCGLALERNPPAAEAIRQAGFDVCSHGWRWIKHYLLNEAEEREHIRRGVDAITRVIGERPYGWYCRYGPSVNTRRLVVEEGGFLYDSDYYGDELPFWKTVRGKPHLVVPYSLTHNDGKYYIGRIREDRRRCSPGAGSCLLFRQLDPREYLDHGAVVFLRVTGTRRLHEHLVRGRSERQRKLAAAREIQHQPQVLDEDVH
jgi:peptidoglycan/xylan/chitin deacetylase (PgdA/CDA1 family)